MHFSALRHPCVGDLTYGADPTLAARLGLHPAVAARALRSASSTPAPGTRSASSATTRRPRARARRVLREADERTASTRGRLLGRRSTRSCCRGSARAAVARIGHGPVRLRAADQRARRARAWPGRWLAAVWTVAPRPTATGEAAPPRDAGSASCRGSPCRCTRARPARAGPPARTPAGSAPRETYALVSLVRRLPGAGAAHAGARRRLGGRGLRPGRAHRAGRPTSRAHPRRYEIPGTWWPACGEVAARKTPRDGRRACAALATERAPRAPAPNLRRLLAVRRGGRGRGLPGRAAPASTPPVVRATPAALDQIAARPEVRAVDPAPEVRRLDRAVFLPAAVPSRSARPPAARPGANPSAAAVGPPRRRQARARSRRRSDDRPDTPGPASPPMPDTDRRPPHRLAGGARVPPCRPDGAGVTAAPLPAGRAGPHAGVRAARALRRRGLSARIEYRRAQRPWFASAVTSRRRSQLGTSVWQVSGADTSVASCRRVRRLAPD